MIGLQALCLAFIILPLSAASKPSTIMLNLQSISIFLLNIITFKAITEAYAIPSAVLQKPLQGPPKHRGRNEVWMPNPAHPIPYKLPLPIDERVNWFEQAHNGSKNGFYKRSSCPGLNMLANRGYIERSGRNITYESLSQAMRDVYNFGDDNVSSLDGLLEALTRMPIDHGCT